MKTLGRCSPPRAARRRVDVEAQEPQPGRRRRGATSGSRRPRPTLLYHIRCSPRRRRRGCGSWASTSTRRRAARAERLSPSVFIAVSRRGLGGRRLGPRTSRAVYALLFAHAQRRCCWMQSCRRWTARARTCAICLPPRRSRQTPRSARCGRRPQNGSGPTCAEPSARPLLGILGLGERRIWSPPSRG